MKIHSNRLVVPAFRRCLVGYLLLTLSLSNSWSEAVAHDYFLAIGGGYNPTGNQASLEANVVFFEQVLTEKHHGSRTLEIYFADGNDPSADLQVLAGKPAISDQPASDLLAALHRRRGFEQVEYRNHDVPHVSGPLDPELIQGSIEAVGRKAHRGDRLIIYVTAHGSPGPEGDDYNTTIDCWDEKKITAVEFDKWLGKLPSDVPVIMVMAQCYCGGFARTIFNHLDREDGLAPQIRVGFFAQQHNLPAAGCRPDIEHDEEFSSYFWGAITGRSRNGVPIGGCDLNGDGFVSMAEAYAYAVTSGETIDIPLKTTDVFLRTYSRLPTDEATADSADTSAGVSTEADANKKSAVTTPVKNASKLMSMTGTLQKFIDQAPPVSASIVSMLSKSLGFSLQDDVDKVLTAYDEHRNHPPVRGRGRNGRRGAGSGRREVVQEIREKWPELADERRWEESPLLKLENQETLAEELKQLPSWKNFDERRKQTAESGDLSARHELREVKFRRLIKTLELIALEKNLPLVAPPEIIARYREMVAVEESGLNQR